MASRSFALWGTVVTLAAACGGGSTQSGLGGNMAAVSGSATPSDVGSEEASGTSATSTNTGSAPAGTGSEDEASAMPAEPADVPGGSQSPTGSANESPAPEGSPEQVEGTASGTAEGETAKGGTSPSSTESEATAESGTGQTDPPATDEPPIEEVPEELPFPSWSGDILPLFARSCGADNTGCHAKEVYVGQAGSDCRGWLSLDNQPLGSTYLGEFRFGETTGCPDVALYDRLMGESWQCDDLPYVTPGAPDDSYLFRKIAGGPYCDNGDVPSDPMPQVGSLSDEDIDLVRRWIEAGAPYDE